MNLLAWLSILLVFVNVGRLHDAFGQYTGAIPAAKVILALGVVGFLVNPSMHRIAAGWRTIQGKALIAFAVSIFVSVPLSYHRSDSASTAMMFAFATMPIIFIMLASIESIDGIERLFKSVVVTVVISAAIIGAGFGIVVETPDGPRTTLAGAYDPNDLALVTASSMAFCLWVIKDRSVFWKLMGFAGLAGGTYIVVRSYSRGGFLALGCLVMLATFVVRGAVPTWFRMAILPMAVVAFLAAPPKYRERVSTLTSTSQDYNTFAETGRFKIWKRGVGYFLSRPLTGVGVGQFSLAEGRWGDSQGITRGWKWSAPHNMYVESAAELGILGIGGLLGMLLPTLAQTFKRVRSRAAIESDPRSTRAAGAIFLGIATYMVGAMFLTAALMPMCTFLATLGIAFQSLPARARAARAADSVDGMMRWRGTGVRRATRWQGRPAGQVANRSA